MSRLPMLQFSLHEWLTHRPRLIDRTIDITFPEPIEPLALLEQFDALALHRPRVEARSEFQLRRILTMQDDKEIGERFLVNFQALCELCFTLGDPFPTLHDDRIGFEKELLRGRIPHFVRFVHGSSLCKWHQSPLCILYTVFIGISTGGKKYFCPPRRALVVPQASPSE